MPTYEIKLGVGMSIAFNSAGSGAGAGWVGSGLFSKVQNFDGIFAVWNPTDGEGTASIVVTFTGSIDIWLDGVRTLRQSLPAGLHMQNVKVNYISENAFQVSLPNGTATLKQGSNTLGVIDDTTIFEPGPVGFFFTRTPILADPNFTHGVVYDGFSLELTQPVRPPLPAPPDPIQGGTEVRVDRLFITGDYQIISFSYELVPEVNTAIAEGSKVRLEDIEGTLDNYDGLILTNSAGDFVDITTFTIESEFLIFFWIPVNLPAGFLRSNLTLWGHLNGTTFSGSVKLGTLQILLADTSGIYTLVPGKTNDTLYDRDQVDTVDVRIPNPFIKTGFIK